MHRIHPRGRGRLRTRLTYANVVASLALFLALAGGSAYAATRLITGSQIAKGTITSRNIKTRSLLATDFAKNQLPAGARGATGAAGPAGATGASGAAGASGPAGSAVAYGSVVVVSSGAPQFNNASDGFTSVTNPDPGVYCLSPSFKDASGSYIEPVFSLIGQAAEGLSLVNNQQCGGVTNGYEIVAYPESSPGDPANIGSGGGFTVEIP